MKKDFKKAILKDFHRELKYFLNSGKEMSNGKHQVFMAKLNGIEFRIYLNYYQNSIVRIYFGYAGRCANNERRSLELKLCRIISLLTDVKLCNIDYSDKSSQYEPLRYTRMTTYPMKIVDHPSIITMTTENYLLFVNFDNVTRLTLSETGFVIEINHSKYLHLYPYKFRDWLRLKRYIAKESLEFMKNVAANLSLINAPANFYKFLEKDKLITKDIAERAILHSKLKD